MTKLTYTDGDLRFEAARQYAEILRSPDLAEVGDEMRNTAIPSASSNDETGSTWGHLPYDDFHDARNQVQELLDDAPNLSRWVIDLSASVLTRTTELAWGHPNNWSLAVQIAHRRGLDDDLHDALVEAVRGAVGLVLDNRGLNCPALPQAAAEAVTL